MKNIKRTLIIVLALSMALSMLSLSVLAAEPTTAQNKVLAHWKLQNDASYFTGDINTDTLKFLDISGNGNDLEVAVEGNGAQLDIFTWDTGVDNDTLKASNTATALKFNNTLANAKSVDTYDAALTKYSGAYVSGKYLQTVKNAPLNSYTGANGWTVEVVFKVTPEWNNEYNRYTGIFSKQGVVESQNEPPFSLALTEKINGENDGSLGVYGTTGLQYLHVDKNKVKTNHEMQNGMIFSDEWVHYMVTSNGLTTYVYCDGQLVKTINETNEIFTVDPSFGWEVGVGRKLKGNEATMNEQHPEGLIRRLFCGTISEIRFTEGLMDINDSLILENHKTEEPTVTTTTAAATTTNAPTTTPTTTPVTTVPATDKVADDKGGCKSSVGVGLGALVATLTLGAATLLKKKKQD